MIVTVLWEDQRGGITQSFGPHELLCACVADRLVGNDVWSLRKLISSVPKKGIGNVIKALRTDGSRLADCGPLLAAIDRDKVYSALRQEERPPTNCLSLVRDALCQIASGACQIVLLIQNVETILEECLKILGQPPLSSKPDPNERDTLLREVAYGSPELRQKLCTAMPSFGRLVDKVVAVVMAGAQPAGPDAEKRGSDGWTEGWPN